MEQSQKKTVLIVDDSPEIRDLYTQKLEESGWSVIVAKDGQEAYELAVQNKPSVLLLDVRMPGMSGMDLLKAVRAEGQWGAHVPTIFLTNVDPTSTQMNDDIAATTPTYYLLKSSITPDSVVEKIDEVARS